MLDHRHAGLQLDEPVFKASTTEATESRGKDGHHTLQTLRFKLFAKAGYITTEGRQNILKLAVAMRHREGVEGLWNQSKTFDLPVNFSPVFSPYWKISVHENVSILGLISLAVSSDRPHQSSIDFATIRQYASIKKQSKLGV